MSPPEAPQPPRAWGRTGDLVRTYKALNDPNAPQWSTRWVGGIAALALVGAAVAAVYFASQDEPVATGVATRTVEQGADGTRTDYVGFSPAVSSADAAALDQAMTDWRAAHPNADVISQEPVFSAGQLVGWHVTYRE